MQPSHQRVLQSSSSPIPQASYQPCSQNGRPTRGYRVYEPLFQRQLPSPVPGHCGIQGNVAADLLAGTGHQMSRFTLSVPPPDVKRWIAKSIRDYWAHEWHQNTSAQLRKVKGDTSSWEELSSLRDQKIISRLRTGHTRFAYNFDGRSFRQECEQCGVHNSAEHVICHCPLYEHHRSTNNIPGSIRDALANDPASLSALICFLKETRLYYRT